MTTERAIKAPSPVDALTAGQRECLRMVYRLQTSKQIARSLGISRHTVDQRISLACRKLGATSRSEAALLLAEYESLKGVSQDSRPKSFSPAPAMPQLGGRFSETEPFVQTPSAFSGANGREHRALPQNGVDWPFPRRDKAENRFSPAQRLGWAFAICGASIVTFALLVTAIDTLGRLI